MKLLLRIPNIAIGKTVTTIGNFDGIHLGHQAMLKRLRERAHALDLPSVVLTFEPHPRDFFSPESAPARITSLREKITLLKAAGVDYVYIFRFNLKQASMSAEDFIENILIRGLNVRHIIIGDDFCFGAGRRGNISTLKKYGIDNNFTVESLQTIKNSNTRVSSSAVRKYLAECNLEMAAILLGYRFNISGRVHVENTLGNMLGYPAVKVELNRKYLPLNGVFVVSITGKDMGKAHGIAILGWYQSTSNCIQPLFEIHFIGIPSIKCDSYITVEFISLLRKVVGIESFSSLEKTVAADVQAAKIYLSKTNTRLLN